MARSAKRPIYVALAVDVDGNKDILGLRVGQGGEGAKYWLGVLNELKNRGVADVCIVVCDGLKGLPEAIGSVWPEAIVQTCVLHLIRNTFRLPGRHDWDLIATALRSVYQAPSEQAARSEFDVFAESWDKKYPAIVRLWQNAWAEFVPFLAYDVEVRKVIFSTNAVESLNARFRRAVRARGHFPSEQAALKVPLILSCGASTRPGTDDDDGRFAGSQRSNAFLRHGSARGYRILQPHAFSASGGERRCGPSPEHATIPDRFRPVPVGDHRNLVRRLGRPLSTSNRQRQHPEAISCRTAPAQHRPRLVAHLSARLDNKQAGRATSRARAHLPSGNAPLKDEEPGRAARQHDGGQQIVALGLE